MMALRGLDSKYSDKAAQGSKLWSWKRMGTEAEVYLLGQQGFQAAVRAWDGRQELRVFISKA